MSDLQTSLVGLGVLLVVGVWGYNKLQERKYRKAAEKVFQNEQADVLVPDVPEDVIATDVHADDAPREPYLPPLDDDVRREPVFSDSQAFEDASAIAHEAPEQFIPETAPIREAETTTTTTAAVANGRNAPPPEWCDESTDLVAVLHFNDGIDVEDLRQSQAAMQAHQRVPLRGFVEVARAQWLPLESVGEGVCTHVWFALQLVDRRGALSTNDFESLRHAMQALASLRSGSLMFPDVAAMGEQARALDEFCAQLDLQLVLNVLDTGNGAFVGTKIRGMAEAGGMRLAESGEFLAGDEAGNFLFALANMGEPFDPATLRNLQTHGLSFMLDVPHAADGGYAFERMLSSARQFATTLDASLVNAQRAPVSDAMVDGIRKKIMEIHEQMTLAGIPAGGVRARRLFS
ncbi:MAG TPA: cell division protein ZipA C-terminal FtsZ-binding domain-containing protein [Rhodocyclaceae bacterium]|nr:cell division protein ZipA C-terminal FtsZ-binding domain-containing protein [Rhodocyclaceae bacterium]